MSDDEAKKTVAKDKNMHKCNLCTLSYASERDLREHFWSLMHHTNIECKKKNSQHNCTLCFTTCGSIAEYRKHLSGEKHKKAAEENRNAEDEKEAAEAREAQHKKSVARVPDKHSNMKDRHTLSDDDDQEQEEQSEGFRRDPIFYKRKKKAQSDKQQTDINQQHSRWDQPDHYHDGDYDRYGNPWDQGYNYRYNNMCHNDYYQNGYHSGYGHPDFQNRYGNGYGWFPPRGGFVGFNGPPRGAVQGPRYVDFDSHENVRMDDDMDMEGESGEEEGVSVHNKEFPSYQGQYWNDYQHNGHPPPPWHGSWNNSSQRGSVGEVEFEQNNEERAVGTKSKKKKKGKWKGKSKTQGERHKGKVNPTNGDSPNAANARKRCRKSDPVKTDPKTSRLGDVNSICAEAKAVMDGFTFQFDKVFSSEHDAETLSHSVRSTSSNKSKSSAKSRSSSSSPSLRLKSLSARKLQNSRVSPKSIRVSPKVNRDSKVVRSELQSEDTNAESGVLEKAEKLCKELREKRQKAKSDKEKIMKSKKNEMRDVLNKQIKTLSDANKSRIKGHLASVEKDSAVSSLQESGIASFSSSQTSADLTASRSSLASSSQTLVSQSEDQTPRNDIERIRHSIENSVRRSLSSPAKPTSSSSESPVNSSKNRKPLSKDSLLKMVNSPRSRNERLHLARMLRTRARTQNKLAPSRLNVQLNGLYDNYEFDEEDIPAISLEDLSPEVKLQIAQLIEDDVNIDLINSEPDTPSSPGIEAKVNLSKPSSISRLEAMEAAAGYGTMANTIQSDAALSIADLNSPPHRPLRESSTDQAVLNVESLETMQFRETSITVTSIDGIPQLQVSEPTVSSNFSPLTLSSPVPTSVPSATSFGDGGQKHMSSAVSSAVDLGRRALQMSGLEDRPSLSHSCTSVAIPSPQSLVPSVNPPQSQYLMSAVLELSLKEEEKQKDIDELERKIDVMRQMLRRTLDHLENSEQRRKELLNDNKKIRERKLKVLRELMGHQSLESPLHTTQLSSPLHAVSENVMTPTRSHLSSESMDIDFVTDCVSSTSQAKPDSNVRIDLPHPDFLSSRLPDQRTEAPSPADTATRLRMQAEDAGKAPKSPSHAAKTGCPSSLAYAGPSDPVTCLQVFNNHLYVCYQGKDIHRYHLVTGEMDMQYNCSYHSVQCMAVVAVPGKEDCIYAGGLSFHVLLFNVKTPHIVQTFELSEEIKCMHYDAGTLYVGLMSGSVEVFEVKNQRHKDSFQCAYQAIHCISSAREGGSKLICVSAQDTTISVCDARSGLPVRILGGHKKTSFSVMSSDHFVFSGSGDRTVMMHNLHTGKLEWTFKEHGGIVTSVWVEGNTLYSAGYDRLVRCFDIKSHTLRKMYYGAGKGVIMSIAVHGDELYTGSREGHVECIQMKAESWPCKIDSCQYVFGVREHLLHHLLTDHVLPNNKLARCMWKDCTDWLTQQKDDGSVEFHMRKHLDSLNGITA
ncbi:uncharacterized protein [Haliotis cracherodii]|uniref:uncharacterized protein isoform X2 n=1 Tax=Haliotis cracherodii TaxID=6455 RepID=UPI0039EC2240